MKKFLVLIAFWVISFPGLTSSPEGLKDFAHKQSQVQLASEIIEKLESNHLVKKDYESIRKEAFDLYLERLDPNKTVFILSELPEINKDSFNKNLISKDLKVAFSLFNLYADRYYSRYNLQIDFLESVEEVDLRSSRKIKRTLSDNERTSNLEELETLWKDLIINDLIQLMLSGNDLDESISKTTKRLNNQLNYFEQTRVEDVFNIFVNSITSIYGPHTSYMSPKNSEDFDINMSLSLEGIGALLSSDGLYTSISSLVPGGPAEKTEQLKPEDKIIGVGQDDDGEIVDVIGWRIDDVVDLIRGPKGSKVRLQIIPTNAISDSETEEIEIVRNVVKLEDQAAEKKILPIQRGQKNYKVGVIALPAFYFDFEAYQKRDYNYKSSSKDVKRLLKELKRENIDGLVIDLRNNGGGSLYEANALAHLFLGRGTTVQVKNSNGNIQGLGERWGYQFYDKPIVILVNKFSASASEILAGAIQDYDRGLILGEQTYGKGTVQNLIDLNRFLPSSGDKFGQVKLTIAKFYRITGSSTQHKGVEPDIAFPSAFSADEYGESSKPSALPWDQINPTKFKSYGDIDSVLPELKKEHQRRVKNNIEFQFLVEDINEMNERREKNSYSLNLETRKEEKEIADQKKKLRDEERQESTELTIKGDEEVKKENLKVDDPLLEESGHILADFILAKIG